ncbi:glyoxalase/bleomycin resistance/extradiol dioxygenase family protein [Fulvivirga sp. RKSG066]|uniref:ArsI/CadI family heavy metal resistance metalloenzyme n=1 Tax=Fulvivirga aurantia TaxID=2529383 RepID=UPI0012BD754B|nr:ArsI/CadI family heavy metal resistance metalloenzyme [Fulvivirga aurantia]MTI21619.1 glyoxalase/bleomycin resistance/extradiol dioxygenase family protein [Fulvivirga aurantia]
MNNQPIFPRIHMSYYVSNIEATIDFYTKFFETEPNKVKEGYAKFLVNEPSLNISFIENKEAIKNDGAHFGIEVNDPEILKQKLGNAMHHNLPIDREKDVTCCYAKQDKFWVTDPDGYRWEVYQFIEDREKLASDAKPQQVGSDNATCCAPLSEEASLTFSK